MIFFFNDAATTEIYTLSLHDALPISVRRAASRGHHPHARPLRPRRLGPGARGALGRQGLRAPAGAPVPRDRKSTRLNSSHANISYAVFCLKKNISRIFTLMSNMRPLP